ncbi:MAG: SpoIIIAH-like family protein [Lachnospiraceae bacterium]|nr:SpoIIIAH-like family protein [Lachnospiraceae bacterium]MCI8994644.1 SpoIIIAH-like family protein [Lachnospiraceae bacterium]MCI9133287.1 SpoIIIAH-like family protein [Lachnospiraceae bacterium]
MKRIVKKNQIIITALAIMIAVAGYLNYSGSKLDLASTNAGTDGDALALDISSEDQYAQTGLEELVFDDGDIASLDADLEDLESAELTQGETPGEAVLTSTTANVGFASEAKISREQLRAKNKEILMEVINNTNISEEQKQEAIDSMIELTDIAERETAAETLLAAKGFEDVVVSITDDMVDVVVNMAEVDDAGRAQIEDIVKRKTGLPGESIVITPMTSQDE